MTLDPIRDLLSRMADALDRLVQHLADDRREVHALAVEARAVLAAEPEGEGPEAQAKALAKTKAILNDPNRALLTEVRETLELNLYALQQLSAPAPVAVPVAIPGEQWHEDDGACLWWRFPIEEPPWSGDPRGDDWPGYHTHFTRIVCPLPQAGEALNG